MGNSLVNKRTLERVQSTAATFLLVCGSVILVFPLIWMISTSLKSDAELFINQSLIPRDWMWSNYPKAWTSVPFTIFFRNTVFITFTGVAGSLISNSLVAYGFARLRFRGKNFLFAVLLATMMIPGSVLMIPSYILYAKLHWVGTFLPLIVPQFFSSAYYVFLLRQFMTGIPTDYSEAAHIEGASEFSIYWSIIMPLAKPALISIAIFEYTAKWNDFMNPLLYLNRESQYTLQLGLRMFQTNYGMMWQLYMAASVLVLIPVAVMFLILQRHFIEGLAMSGVKN